MKTQSEGALDPRPYRRSTLSDVDIAWEEPGCAVRGPTRPWDDLCVLLALASPPEPAPPPSPTRGGTRSWDELLADVRSPAAPQATSPTRGGTLRWDTPLFEAPMGACIAEPALEVAPAAHADAEPPPPASLDRFDDLALDEGLDALARDPSPLVPRPPSARRPRKPELPSLSSPWTRDEPRIEIASDAEIDAGELSILLGGDDD